MYYFPVFFLFLLFIFPFQDEEKYSKMRKNMVEHQLKTRDITDPKVLDAMSKVKRHLFVDDKLKNAAHNDHPLPIGEEQTISQPYIVALMTQLLDVKPDEKILEIGTGSGYQAAVLSELADSVFTIEIIEKLAKMAEKRLKNLGYHNVKVKYGDGYYGWKEHAPYDAIIITAAADNISPILVEQLKEGGRILLPLGGTNYWQTLTIAAKKDGKLTNIRRLSDVIFVPMTGEILKKK